MDGELEAVMMPMLADYGSIQIEMSEEASPRSLGPRTKSEDIMIPPRTRDRRLPDLRGSCCDQGSTV